MRRFKAGHTESDRASYWGGPVFGRDLFPLDETEEREEWRPMVDDEPSDPHMDAHRFRGLMPDPQAVEIMKYSPFVKS